MRSFNVFHWPIVWNFAQLGVVAIKYCVTWCSFLALSFSLLASRESCFLWSFRKQKLDISEFLSFISFITLFHNNSNSNSNSNNNNNSNSNNNRNSNGNNNNNNNNNDNDYKKNNNIDNKIMIIIILNIFYSISF